VGPGYEHYAAASMRGMGRQQTEHRGGEARSAGWGERQVGHQCEGGGGGAQRGCHEGIFDERGVNEASGRCRWPATRFLSR
jgi:hypothetical protein